MKSKMSSVRKIIIDSRYFLNDAPAGKGTFELSEIVEIHNSQVMFLESFQCVNSCLRAMLRTIAYISSRMALLACSRRGSQRLRQVRTTLTLWDQQSKTH